MMVLMDVLMEAALVMATISIPFATLALMSYLECKIEKKRQQAEARRRESRHQAYVADMFRQIG